MEGMLQRVVSIIVAVVIFFILPVYVAYEKDANVSGFIKGNKNLNFLPYESIDEVLEYIDKICQ